KPVIQPKKSKPKPVPEIIGKPKFSLPAQSPEEKPKERKEILKHELPKFKEPIEPKPEKKSAFSSLFKKKPSVEKTEIESLKKKTEKPVIKPEKISRAKLTLEKHAPEKEFFTTYSPSPLGTLANRYFRNIGEAVLSKYPESFEKLFKALRYANMKILSKTYLNVILFVSTFTFFALFLIIMLFGFFDLSLYTLLIRPLIFAVLFSIAAFGIAYAYPFIKADQRAKNMDANLPFAINHMSAVANSGLPPDMMFRIVSQSKEYAEIGVELRKLMEYIDLFGYDLTTAMQTVAAATPSRNFKEFLDGAIATLTSGGDFGLFLKEKSDQSMFAYKLRMEKYNETVSTYSDVYMGIMIVAPVFFYSNTFIS
ncbi:type II secretion system F family protein, partial [Candidatus Woesearchaeota archaeon]|nr:type II secretion system F family protein [Candidatus Woesearchaeota archaeon]